MSSSSWLIWEPQWLSGSTLTPDPRNTTSAQRRKSEQWQYVKVMFFFWMADCEYPPELSPCNMPFWISSIFIPMFLRRTCGEHARVGVSRGQTHVLLDASAGAFGHPLDRQVLWLLQYPPPRTALLVMNGIHGAVQWWLKGLQLGGGLPQQEACHKLTQHWWTLILLNESKWRKRISHDERERNEIIYFFINHSFLIVFRNISRVFVVDMMDLIFSSGDYMNCEERSCNFRRQLILDWCYAPLFERENCWFSDNLLIPWKHCIMRFG